MSPNRPELTSRPGLGPGLEAAWVQLGAPGAVWTGEERIAIVAEARAARRGEPPIGALDEIVAEAARVVAVAPASIRRAWIDRLLASGLDHARYVELVAVVSRAVAIDTAVEGLGLEPASLPEPQDGEPTGETDGRARPAKAWVPMVGGASITQALSLLPAENRALEELHGHLYLSFEEMAEPVIAKGLSRPQMELVAARTSAANECFY